MAAELLQALTSLSFLVCVLVLAVGYFAASNLKAPPGPRPLPLVGNMLQLDLQKLPDSLWKLSEEFGSVFSVQLGAEKWVVLVGYETVKEALVDNAEAFGGRSVTVMMEETVQGHGITWSNGETSREMRALFLRVLKDTAMEKKIEEESGHLVNALQGLNGKALDMMELLNYAISNVLCVLIYGQRFEYDDVRYSAMIDRLYERTLLNGDTAIKIYNLFPCLKYLIKDRAKIWSIMETFRAENLALIRGLRETLNPQMCRGFVDAFLLKQKQVQESGAADGVFAEENLVHSIMSLLVGTQSSATILRWLLLLMAKYQHIQDQVREEIVKVIGSRQVQTEDRKHMPFTDAVIHETFRFKNFAPMGIGRRTTRDVTFQGHFIKEGTTVWPHLTSIHSDEKEWEKPHAFHPDHFLDKDGKFMERDAFIPFSAGFRACPGARLGQMELFVFFVTLMQRFRLTAPPGVPEKDLNLTGSTGFIMRPEPHLLCAVPL